MPKKSMRNCSVDDVLRGQHGLEDLLAEDGGQRGEDRGEEQAERNDVVEVLAQSRLVLCAKSLTDWNGEAAGQSHAETDDQEVDRPGRPYRRQGLDPEAFGDNDCVGHGIELLEQVANQHGKHECEDQPHRAALGKVLRHALETNLL